MFLGTFYLKFTGKGRVILPKKIRQELKRSEIILMKGLDGGIWGFAEKEWEEFTSKQLEIPVTEEKGRDLRRRFFPFAEECALDSQGRFIIPEGFLKEVGIKKELVLIGTGDHFELWSLDKWREMVKVGEKL